MKPDPRPLLRKDVLTPRSGVGLSLLLAGLASCGADAGDSGGEWWGDFQDAGGGGAGRDTGSNPGNGDDAAGTGSDVGVDAPPEEEDRLRLSAPTASSRYVFIANRSLDSVAKIDSLTLAVTPIPVGPAPTIVRTSDSGDTAIVLNTGGVTGLASVSIIEAGVEEDIVTELEVLEGSNSLLLAPGSDHAIAWFDNGVAEAGDPIGSLQDVSLIDVRRHEVWSISVGFQIREIEFDESGDHAYVVTQSGLNDLLLASVHADQASRTIGFGDDPLNDVPDREVEVSNRGGFALIRSGDFSGIRVLDIAAREATTIALPGVPTDLDLLADDSGAVVAIRGTSQIAWVPLPDAVEDPDTVRLIDVTDAPAGLVTLTSDQSRALLYTTAIDDRRVGVLDLDSDLVISTRTLYLRKGMRLIAAAPQPNRALVVHSHAAGTPVPGEDVDAFIDKSEAVGLLDLDDGYHKLVLLPVEPDAFQFTSDGNDLFLMLADRAMDVRRIEWLDMNTFARRSIPLDALPDSIGLVPGTGRIFVAQEAENGRITFIDPEDGAVFHISAFQLNAYIE